MKKSDSATSGRTPVKQSQTISEHERGGSLNPAPLPVSNKKKSAIEKREKALDDALDDTFPGSDPIAW